jgi:hypothetical protein
MRSVLSFVLALTLAVSVLIIRQAGVAEAGFHCMRIHAAMGGFSGNNNIQYVELRMDSAGQLFVSGQTIQFRDASGTLKATFTFPSNLANSSTGESILIATSEFNGNVTGGAADFTFSMANTTGANGGDPLHPAQVPGGSVVFASGSGGCTASIPVDSLAYGSATATYGTAAAALPNPGNTTALRLNNLNTTPSNNSTEYALQNVSASTFSVTAGNLPTDFATPRNNGRMVLKLNAPAPPVGGIAEDPASLGGSAAAVRESDDSGQRGYAIAGGVAAAAIACGAGWYVYRRRTQ